MITLGQADMDVARYLPPAKGEFARWDWQTLYNAIMLVMQHPASEAAYYTAYRMIAKLPENMRMTPQILAAGWARFTQLYPGWKTWDYQAAYDSMNLFLKQTGRMLEGDDRQWWRVEQQWQAMEVPDIEFIRAPAVARRW